MVPAAKAAARRGAFDLGLAAALGALQTLAYVHSAAWPLQLACIGLLAALAARRTPAGAASLGWAYGTAWLAAGTWWLYVSLHDYGGLAAPLAVASVALLSAALALYLAAAVALWVRLRSGHAGRDAFLFGACWLLAELCRGVIFTGFPWVASGYAHVDSPLGGYAPWVGVYGLGAIGAALAAWLALARPAEARGWIRVVVVAVAVLGVGLLAGRVSFTAPAGSLSVTLLQGNVPQDEKFATEFLPRTLEWTREQLLGARADLVVGPETVVPLLPSQLDAAWWDEIARHFRDGRQAALIGIPLGNATEGYTNSVLGIAPGRPDYRYDKHHLVPFGEFVPAGFHWFVRLMDIPLGDFNRGPLAAPSFVVGSQRVAPNICYEDLFGEELAQRFGDPERAPTLFANVSNIAWFGRTDAVEQHLRISRLRALEFQHPMIRATNTGATAVIDHQGRVVAALEPWTQGTLDAVVEGRNGLTPFARWASAFDLWPAWLLGAGMVVVAAWRRPRVRVP